MKSHSNTKMPGLTFLYCCSVILGGITTISTVLSMSRDFLFFYSLFLIPPILQLIALRSRNNRLLMVGFYGAVCLHIFEYVLGGYLYGFPRLLSTFGPNIIGYFIAVTIWWCYLHFSKKAAAYFNVNRITSWKSTSSSAPTSVEVAVDSNITDSSNSLATHESSLPEIRSSHSYIDATIYSPQTPYINQSIKDAKPLRRPLKINRKTVNVVLIILLLISSAFNIYQFSIVQSSRTEISKALQDISALQEKIDRQEKTLSDKEDEYEKLQEDYAEASFSLFILKYRAFYILDDGTKYYHFYDCPLVQAHDGEYWIHNLEYCKYLGYSPCPYCSPN